MKADKNLRNVTEELEQTAVTSHEAQQMNQAKNDRRKRAIDGKKENR